MRRTGFDRSHSMSLKTRLRLSILSLVIAIVLLLSAVYMRSLASARFEDITERTTMTALQVQGILTQRVNEQAAGRPVPEDLEATRTFWNEIVESDEELSGILRDTMASSRTIVAILITSGMGRVLASSDPNLPGTTVRERPSFEAWQTLSPWRKLYEVFTRNEEYESSLSVGTSASAPPVFRVRVIVSSVLLRNAVRPQMIDLSIALALSLLAAIFLAVLAARLAFQPLRRIGQAIDRISGGEAQKETAGVEGEPEEVAAVQTKLDVLGQQFRGAREDASKLQGRIEQLMERLEEAIMLFDRNDRLIMASRSAEAFLGFGRWDMMGRGIDEVLPASSALGAVVLGALELRRSLRDHLLTVDREGAIPLRVLVNLEILEDFPNRDRVGTLLTLRDAETRRQIGAQIDVSLRLAAISRLTGGVAHEIKNPLNAITLHLEVLKAKLGADVTLVGSEIEIISREMSRLDRVVKTFLDFAKPIELRLEDLDLRDIATEVAALVKPQAERQNVRVLLDTGGSPAWMRGDRDLLKQAAINLVVNGVDAMKDGGSLRIQTASADGGCVLSVSDEGIGIPPEVREKIFNLYFSTKGKGSGIGLAVTYRVVQMHGGTIEISSEVGKGTTFHLKFPAIERVEAV